MGLSLADSASDDIRCESRTNPGLRDHLEGTEESIMPGRAKIFRLYAHIGFHDAFAIRTNCHMPRLFSPRGAQEAMVLM
jgi:hypothetical protein